MDEVRDRWQAMGEQDPLWSVLSVDGKEHGRWSPDEFFAVGEVDVDRIHRQAAAIGIDPTRGEALDFGCGVGRLSLPLARRYRHVTGVDVADSMVARARDFADKAAIANADFVVNTEPSLPFADGSFDFAVAWIVLQHLRPGLARTYIAELVRVLKLGGLLVFQLPSELRAPSQSRSAWKRRVMAAIPDERVQQIHRLRAGKAGIRAFPMYGVRRANVIDFVEARGGQVAGVIEDNAAGSTWRSFHYFIQRVAPLV